MAMQTELGAVISSFNVRLVQLIDGILAERVRAVVHDALAAPKRGPGRPPRNGHSLTSPPASAPRKRLPKQLCPVPRCKGVAAPAFGMVCAKHKDVSKAKIKKFREARRARKAA